jgi:addiction module RelB/DinJ family antitoxin
MKTVIQTRIDSSVRQSAENILNSMGLSLNDGIRMFLHQLITDRAMPFRPSVGDEPNEYLKKCIAEVEDGKNLIKFDSVEDFSKWLDSEVEE